MHDNLPKIESESDAAEAIFSGNKIFSAYGTLIGKVNRNLEKTDGQFTPEIANAIANAQNAGLDTEDIDQAIEIGNKLKKSWVE